jgi:hypothetical protein
MNRSQLRRRVDTVETATGIDSADLDALSVVELLSYDVTAVDDDVIRIEETGELRQCSNADAVVSDVRVFFED